MAAVRVLTFKRVINPDKCIFTVDGDNFIRSAISLFRHPCAKYFNTSACLGVKFKSSRPCGSSCGASPAVIRLSCCNL